MSTSMIAWIAASLVVGLVVVVTPEWIRRRRKNRPQTKARRWTIGRVLLTAVCTLVVLLPVQVAVGMVLGTACRFFGCTAQDLMQQSVLVWAMVVSVLLAIAIGWVLGHAVGNVVRRLWAYSSPRESDP